MSRLGWICVEGSGDLGGDCLMLGEPVWWRRDVVCVKRGRAWSCSLLLGHVGAAVEYGVASGFPGGAVVVDCDSEVGFVMVMG